MAKSDIMTLTEQGYRESEREKTLKKWSREEITPMQHLVDHIKQWAGTIKDFLPFAEKPLTKLEKLHLPPRFKGMYSDLELLNGILGRDTSRLKALETQAQEWVETAKHFDGTQDTTRVLNYLNHEYHYPAKELETERRSEAKFDAHRNRIIQSLRFAAERTPDVLTEATQRVEMLRKTVTLEQPYEEMQAGLEPITLPVAQLLERLGNPQAEVKAQTLKALNDAKVDSGAILKENRDYDPRSGQPRFDLQTQQLRDIHDKQAEQARQDFVEGKPEQAPTPVPTTGDIPPSSD